MSYKIYYIFQCLISTWAVFLTYHLVTISSASHAPLFILCIARNRFTPLVYIILWPNIFQSSNDALGMRFDECLCHASSGRMCQNLHSMYPPCYGIVCHRPYEIESNAICFSSCGIFDSNYIHVMSIGVYKLYWYCMLYFSAKS